MRKQSPIGVFDSGIGGLTVTQTLTKVFPNEEFIYVADNKNCPYGSKTNEEIAGFVTDITRYLMSRDVKAIVIACNTATAQSGHLGAMTELSIIGVIDPTAEEACRVTNNRRVAVLATESTVKSGLYGKKLRENGIEPFELACPDFVPLVEGNKIDTKESYDVVAKRLAPLLNQDIDTVILGCTHFPYLKKEIQAALPNAKLVDSGMPTARVLYAALDKKGLLRDATKQGGLELLTTFNTATLRESISWMDIEYTCIGEVRVSK